MKLSKLVYWLNWALGNHIETRYGYFLNGKLNIMLILTNDYRNAIGYVIYGDIINLTKYEPLKHCSGRFDNGLIKELESKGLMFVEDNNL